MSTLIAVVFHMNPRPSRCEERSLRCKADIYFKWKMPWSQREIREERYSCTKPRA